jgi:hypothetical protein
MQSRVGYIQYQVRGGVEWRANWRGLREAGHRSALFVWAHGRGALAGCEALRRHPAKIARFAVGLGKLADIEVLAGRGWGVSDICRYFPTPFGDGLVILP